MHGYSGRFAKVLRQPAPVGTKGHAPDPVGVPLERTQLSTAGRVPDLDRPIQTRRSKSAAAGDKGYAPDHAGMGPSLWLAREV
jgi:hypothetical protein